MLALANPAVPLTLGSLTILAWSYCRYFFIGGLMVTMFYFDPLNTRYVEDMQEQLDLYLGLGDILRLELRRLSFMAAHGITIFNDDFLYQVYDILIEYQQTLWHVTDNISDIQFRLENIGDIVHQHNERFYILYDNITDEHSRLVDVISRLSMHLSIGTPPPIEIINFLA